MKEMIYSGNGKSEILHVEWNNHGQALAVVNVRGSHPCAYIQFPELKEVGSYDDIYIGSNGESEIDEDFWIHGGFTYLGSLENLGLPGDWIGWDYAHSGDWTQSMPPQTDVFNHEDERKYTTEEIVNTARKALDYISKGYYYIEKTEY